MGRIFVVDLEGKTYNCKFCKTQLALVNDLISKDFLFLMGKAYMLRNMIVGWKFMAILNGKNHKYKEEKFVLEIGRIVDSEFYIDNTSQI
ncbi:PREDICTED: protein yippee-like At5g53940 [Nicotiana attenuata]|uniref:protein yippee-like At5g53940 n=1 Tax=Nicotiana attenuata TaxID=49451 RepID=UPI0009055E6B|nr:PREDICTED: protein yippee-like At5g53940 [Nicotiana attenuata]